MLPKKAKNNTIKHKTFIYIAHHHAPTNPPLVTSPSHILKYSIAQYDIFRLLVS